MIVVREYLDRSGDSPYAAWFDSLNAEAAAKATTAVIRVSLGNFSNVEGVGPGSLNTSSTSALAAGFISARTVKRLSSCWAGEQNGASSATSTPRLPTG